MNEKPLTYHLEETKGAIEHKTYKAVLSHDDETMESKDVFAQIAEQLHYSSSVLLERDVNCFLSLLIANTLADGRTRKVGDFLSVRLGIDGTFEHLNEAYDERKHSLYVNFVGLSAARKLQRKMAPLNTQKPNLGCIDAVYSEDGEKGVIHYGRKIIIEGTNLKLSAIGRVLLGMPDSEWKKTGLRYTCPILENTDTRLVCDWPQMRGMTLETFLSKKKGKVIRLEYDPSKTQRGRGNGTPHGRHAHVKFAP